MPGMSRQAQVSTGAARPLARAFLEWHMSRDGFRGPRGPRGLSPGCFPSLTGASTSAASRAAASATVKRPGAAVADLFIFGVVSCVGAMSIMYCQIDGIVTGGQRNGGHGGITFEDQSHDAACGCRRPRLPSCRADHKPFSITWLGLAALANPGFQ